MVRVLHPCGCWASKELIECVGGGLFIYPDVMYVPGMAMASF